MSEKVSSKNDANKKVEKTETEEKQQVILINKFLVEIFNDILTIEQKAVSEGVFKDLSITEIHTIEVIGLYKARTMSEVANDLKITVGTLTTAINNLVKKGYVIRKRIEEDRRVVMIELTQKGQIAHRMHSLFHSNMVKQTIKGLNVDEEKILMESLKKLNVFLKSV